MEKRHNYVRKVAETAAQLFLTNDKANVSGLIMAGSADFKTELGQSDMFDQRLQAKIDLILNTLYILERLDQSSASTKLKIIRI